MVVKGQKGLPWWLKVIIRANMVVKGQMGLTWWLKVIIGANMSLKVVKQVLHKYIHLFIIMAV